MERTGAELRFRAALAALVALAAAVRLPALRSELWLDEVWSLGLARSVSSAAGVLLRIRHDNSHPLNTLYLYFVSGRHDWATYRLPAFACGLLTVAALGWDPEDRPRGLLTAALAAASTPLVLYATEARGYAPLALFSASCYALLRGKSSPARIAAFWACAALGFLSHATFVFVFAALLVERAARLPASARRRELAVLFGPPLAAFLALEAVQLPGLTIGSGDFYPFGTALLKTAAEWSGAPGRGAAAALGGAALAGLALWELRELRRRRSPELFFFAALFAGTGLFFAAVPFHYERYLFAALPFTLLLAARSLARLIRAGGAPRAAALALLALFFAGSGARDLALAREGRGHYLEALRRMAADTPGDAVTVAGDHCFRTPMMLDFYAPYVTPPKRFVYARGGAAEAPAEWYLGHTLETDGRTAPAELGFRNGASYRFVTAYPYAGLSGWTWLLYRRDAR